MHQKLSRQVVLYLIFGAAQFGLDCLLFSILVHFRVDLKFANIFTRFCAAFAGFLLNGLYTFRHTHQTNIRLPALMRYVSLWAILTTMSTLALLASNHLFGPRWLPVAKVFIEIFLACTSFVAMKAWIYRRPDSHHA